MSITLQGTVPYPPMAEARPIAELANELRQVGQSLHQTSGQLNQTSATATATWSGMAAESFSTRMQGRSQAVSQVGRLLGQAGLPLHTLAAAITSTQAAYNGAVAAEQAARAGLPYTAAALAAAIAAEGAAVGAHQAAGAACGAAVGRIVFQIAAIEVFGERSGATGTQPAATTTTAAQSTWGEWTSNLWEWVFGGDDDQPATPVTAGPTDAIPTPADETTHDVPVLDGRAQIEVSDVVYTGAGTWRSGSEACTDYVNQALDVMGITDPAARANWTRGLLTMAERESTYNHPRWLANTNDSNAHGATQVDGAPANSSRGPWQTIPTTFARYHVAGTSTNIYDPVASAAAAINYVQGRYGVAADGSNLATRVRQADPTRGPRGY